MTQTRILISLDCYFDIIESLLTGSKFRLYNIYNNLLFIQGWISVQHDLPTKKCAASTILSSTQSRNHTVRLLPASSLI